MTGDQAARLRLTVGQLLEVPDFRLRLVAGAAGLDRPVRWAHSTELLDPGPYLRGNEVVLTVGASLTDPARCAAFARSVHASRASAIGYGIGDVLPASPDALRAACDDLDLPLLEVPPEVPFLSFTEWFAERLTSSRDVQHEREETGRLLEMVRNGLASPEAVRNRLERTGLTPEPIVVLAVPAPSVPDRVDGSIGAVLGIDGDVALLLVNTERHALELAEAWGGVGGLGTPGPLDRLPQCLAESVLALEASQRGGGVVRAADLATFQGLLGRLERHQIAPFIDQIARPLADYDAAHGTRLVETLRTFLGTGGAVGTTSRELYLHPNTLRHRLTRIAALTGRDPLNFDDRVALAVAMWADR
ncbi:PucR family transcriptional regulator [Actinomadura rugatobispora]|uniref:PucR family transcriptional regulator n=1 Tax=Actinomadura rugatobispora TaxID=1994 RepID=A0ABW1A6N5_9ACTN|nr:PucR family transcriptional regulator [Actinomadura rugatobispora]